MELCGANMLEFENIDKELMDLSLTRQTATDEQMKAANYSFQYKPLGVEYMIRSYKQKLGKMVKDINNDTFLNNINIWIQ